ncbi:sensor histidine kinase [Streptomyces odonnellii]|uniref:sensor histidine kinase n=1 Tax=Streptomyces odonnellii TaxID=1417980 RepID=UPI00099C25DB|nr:ATP-binding protein [Streptomyces odonnellii]
MVRPEAPPNVQAPPTVRALLVPAALMVAATALAVTVAADTARLPLALYGAVATVLVTWCAVELSRRGRTIGALHEHYAHRLAQLERRTAAHDEETVRLGKELMPAAIHRLRQGESPEEAIRAVVDGDERHRELPAAQRSLLGSVLRIVDDEEAMRDSAQRSFVNIARRVQAIVHQQAGELREMEEHHGRDPDVFDDLLRIDHGTALIGRLADSIAVLGRARPGRQWPRPVPLFSVLRGAMSRILEYQRVDLHSIAKVAVVGTAVEPLIHACAELLDNATRYSPPQTRVHVTAVEVQTGIAIEIEDGGVSLSEEARARAERMLAQAQAGIDLNDLGETPRLGMAVVGRLCQMYDLQVSLRQSAYGGVRAVLVVPRESVTTGPAPGIAHGIGAAAGPRGGAASGLPAEDAPRPGGRAHPERRAPGAVIGPQWSAGPRRSAPVVESRASRETVVTEWTENGLPQRRSRGRAPLGSHRPALRAAAPYIEDDQRSGGDRARGTGPHGAQSAAPDSARSTARDTARSSAPESASNSASGPGIWLEAFTRAVNGTPQEPPAAADEPSARPPDDPPAGPGSHGESDNLRGKGDLK